MEGSISQGTRRLTSNYSVLLTHERQSLVRLSRIFELLGVSKTSRDQTYFYMSVWYYLN